jgi:hypothetical protein
MVFVIEVTRIASQNTERKSGKPRGKIEMYSPGERDP